MLDAPASQNRRYKFPNNRNREHLGFLIPQTPTFTISKPVEHVEKLWLLLGLAKSLLSKLCEISAIRWKEENH
jgi:hypothetical protein